MSAGRLSPLLLEWTDAIVNIKIDNVHLLLKKEPELLWTPIPQTLDDVDHLLNELQQLNRLGTSFQPICAIHYTLLYYQDVSTESINPGQLSRYQLLSYLIEQSTVHDLDTRFWGAYNNTVIHLVSFLGLQHIAQQLIEKGVTFNSVNELGYTPRDVANSEAIFQYLNTANHKHRQSLSRTKTVRPNYSNPNRFKLLKELAEESSLLGDESKKGNAKNDVNNNSYFKKGRVKETQKKVLTEEEVELEKQRLKRQQEVAQLVKKSAVKNNPLFKKLETRSFTSPIPSPSTSGSIVISDTNAQDPAIQSEKEIASPIIKRTPKRNSKVISSLKVKSYVSTSIFVQADDTNEKTPPHHPLPPPPPHHPLPPTPIHMSPTSYSAEASPHNEINHSKTFGNEMQIKNTDHVLEDNEMDNTAISDGIISSSTELENNESFREPKKVQSIKVNETEIKNSTKTQGLKNEYVMEKLEITNNETMADVLYYTQEPPQEIRAERSDVAHNPDYEMGETSHSEDSDGVDNIPTKNMGDNATGQVYNRASTVQQQDIRKEPDRLEPYHSDHSDHYEMRYTDVFENAEEAPVTQDEELADESFDYLSAYMKMQEEASSSEDDETEFYDTQTIEDEAMILTPRSSALDSYQHEIQSNPDNDSQGDLTISPTLSTAQTSSLMSNDCDDSEFDSDYENDQAVQFSARVVNPVYRSVVIINDENPKNKATYQKYESVKNTLFNIDNPSVRPTSTIANTDESPINENIQKPIPDESNPCIIPPAQDAHMAHTVPSRPQRSNLRQDNTCSDSIAATTQKEIDMKRRSGSQKASWTMSMTSWAAILDKEFSLDELDPNKKYQQQIKQKSPSLSRPHPLSPSSMDSVNAVDDALGKLQVEMNEEYLFFEDDITNDSQTSLAFASKLELTLPTSQPQQNMSTENINPPQLDVPLLQPKKSVHRKPINASVFKMNETNRRSASVSPTTIVPVKKARVFKHGKLYLHVNGIQDILLPLPKDRAYVRCVVSDGRFEYMSRYEILAQDISFNYECVIDTHPDMIITISLHVRPDYVMKSRKPFVRFFTSKKKKKECLSGYVNKEDGAIGQARFALAHMLPVCEETAYVAGFHCFNAWYSKTFKERHRQKKTDPNQDVLKVVGNFDVEMLYIHVEDRKKQTSFPRNLRECEKSLENYI